MSRLELDGVAIEVPDGWEAELGWVDGAGDRRMIAHMANFALPPVRGDYGSGAVETMDAGGVFVTLLEFTRTADGSGLFSGVGVPSRLSGADFSADQLQRRLPGQAGVQRFFTVGDRRFVLYVVIGAHRRRDVLAAEVTRLLARVSVD